jgi:lipopolysaccharide export system permease protein
MFKLQRYYLREFIKLFSLLSVGLAFIFSILELVEKMDEFLPYKPSLDNLLLYMSLNFPKFLLYLLPAALLICALFIFSQASRSRELTAIKATGGRLKVILYPFITLGLGASIFAFVVGEIVVPDFSKRANELRYILKKEQQKIAFQEGSLWIRGEDGSIARIELYIPEKNLAQGVSIFVLKEDTLIKRIEAQEARWKTVQNPEPSWLLRNVTIYDIPSGNVHKAAEIEYPDLGSPNLFTEGIKTAEEMGIIELYRYNKRLQKSGFKNTKLEVDFNSKISYPLINLFMVLLGISLAMRGTFGGGLFAAGLGLLISTIYWFTYTMTLSLGYAGVIPPFFAAWFMPFVFGVVSVLLFKKIPE